MNIMREYTLDYVKRNRKSSISISVAIMLATAMLSVLIGVMYTFYKDEVKYIKQSVGDWHAELLEPIRVDKLKYITGHPGVDKVLIKDNPRIAYIGGISPQSVAIQRMNAEYWDLMPDKSRILEGRAPRTEQELAVDEGYFKRHPNVKLGDAVTLDPASLNPGYTGERSYTIVGKLNLGAWSVEGADYSAYGYMEEAGVDQDELLNVRIRFGDVRSAYHNMSFIAGAVGLGPDAQGLYKVRANVSLLSKYLVFDPDQTNFLQLLTSSQIIGTVIVSLIASALFVLIIHNAFGMSANSRLRQLGMLKSIGATPKQIRRSVIYEGFLLATLSIPAGLGIGWMLNYAFFEFVINPIKVDSDEWIQFSFLPVLLPAVLPGLLVVWLSALLPAWRVSRLSPIDAIRQGGNVQPVKLRKRGSASALFGLEGELAENALRARRKSYRTATISLTLSFMLFSSFMNLSAILEARINPEQDEEQARTIILSVQNAYGEEGEMERQVQAVPGVAHAIFSSSTHAGLLVSPEIESRELQSSGGLKSVVKAGVSFVYMEKEGYRIRNTLLGLDDESFKEYCREIGADASLFYDQGRVRTIVVQNGAEDSGNVPPFLNLSVGEGLEGTEKLFLNDTSSHTFLTEIGYLAPRGPLSLKETVPYSLTQVMPRSQYLNIVKQFKNYNVTSRLYMLSGSILIQPEASLEDITSTIRAVGLERFDENRFSVQNINDIRKKQEQSMSLIRKTITCVSVFLAVIGISNVFSTVSANLAQRKKEFAMLRSLGATPRVIRRILLLEGTLLGLVPILISIPLNAVFVAAILWKEPMGLGVVLRALPYVPILCFISAILGSILLAYGLGERMLRRDPISVVLRDGIL